MVLYDITTQLTLSSIHPPRLGKLAEAPPRAHDSGGHSSGGLPFSDPHRAIVRDPRFARLLAHMTTLTAHSEGGGGEGEERAWSSKASTLILNGLGHLVLPSADNHHHLLPLLRRVVGLAADSLLLQEAAALAPRHVSLALNALARLLPVLEPTEGEDGDGDTVARRAEWGLFVSAMVARCVHAHIRCATPLAHAPTTN